MSTPSNVTLEGAEETIPVELTRSERHTLLASERRRLTLDVLDGTAPCTLEDLAVRIARREVGEPTSHAVERISVSLHHVHLPRLDAAGVLEYDRATHRIEPIDPER